MLKSIFIFLVSLIGLPLYAVCVVSLYVIGAAFGISYVDSSVYVCEYVQPIFTAAVALIFLIFAIRGIWRAIHAERWGILTSIALFCLIYIYEIRLCIAEFMIRVSTYAGMTNRQIFNFVVKKLQDIGEVYPTMTIHIPTGESVTYGYIMANMEVYLLPLSIVLLCGIIQWRLNKRMKLRSQTQDQSVPTTPASPA